MGVADTIKNKFTELFKDLTGIDDIERDTLKDLIDTEAEGHKSFVKIVSSLTKNDLDKMKQKLSIAIPSSKVKTVSYWQEYQKSLQNKGNQLEYNRMFDSIIKTRTVYGKIMSDISSKLSKIFDDYTPIQNIRKSQYLVLSLLVQSIILSNWSLYMWTLLSSVIDGTAEEIPKYRLDFIAKHNKSVIDCVNGTLANEKIDIIDSLMKLKEKGQDTVATNDGVVNKNFAITTTTVVLGISQIFLAAAAIYGIYSLIRWNQERMEVAAHEKYLKNKEMKEWLEAHVAKLRMDLQEMNPNDPQYQKTLKIIEAYDEKIRDLDQKINEYLEV